MQACCSLSSKTHVMAKEDFPSQNYREFPLRNLLPLCFPFFLHEACAFLIAALTPKAGMDGYSGRLKPPVTKQRRMPLPSMGRKDKHTYIALPLPSYGSKDKVTYIALRLPSLCRRRPYTHCTACSRIGQKGTYIHCIASSLIGQKGQTHKQ